MATVINFVVDAGSKFEGIATIQNEDGTLFNLTGFNIYCQMKKSFYSTRNVIDITSSGAAAGEDIDITTDASINLTATLGKTASLVFNA